MAFDLERFYRELDEHYEAHDLSATEAFLTKSRETAKREGEENPLDRGCPSCAPSAGPNLGYVSVCNETACFYRGLSRFQESLEMFSLARQELEQYYRQETEEYATVLLNQAGTYRYMGDGERALDGFARAAEILERVGGHEGVLAGLYNNMGLVYLDQKDKEAALRNFQRALSLIDGNPDQITEQGSTWNNLAACYQAMNQMEKAEEAAQKAVSILSQLDCGTNPHYPAALNTRGTLAYRKGQYRQALDDFTEALEKTRLVYGENIEYMYGCENCAAVCEKLEQWEEAAQWKEKAEQIRGRLG